VPDVLVLKAADLLQLKLEIAQARGNANSFFSGIKTVQCSGIRLFSDSGIGLFSVQG